MNRQNKIAGVVLAGGRGSRMECLDKGLVQLSGQPLVHYALQNMLGLAPEVMISANRNLDQYRKFERPVLVDADNEYSGPLAGVLAALQHTRADILLVVPCDAPFFSQQHLGLLLEMLDEQHDVVIASSGQDYHPVFMALKTSVKSSLAQFLAGGGRKVMEWVSAQRWISVDYTHDTRCLTNINSLVERDQVGSRARELTRLG